MLCLQPPCEVFGFDLSCVQHNLLWCLCAVLPCFICISGLPGYMASREHKMALGVLRSVGLEMRNKGNLDAGLTIQVAIGQPPSDNKSYKLQTKILKLTVSCFQHTLPSDITKIIKYYHYPGFFVSITF